MRVKPFSALEFKHHASSEQCLKLYQLQRQAAWRNKLKALQIYQGTVKTEKKVLSQYGSSFTVTIPLGNFKLQNQLSKMILTLPIWDGPKQVVGGRTHWSKTVEIIRLSLAPRMLLVALQTSYTCPGGFISAHSGGTEMVETSRHPMSASAWWVGCPENKRSFKNVTCSTLEW